MEYEIYRDDELMHWGIRGMRWGVRRYQNKDGSLTAAGKKRLKAESAALKEKEEVLKRRKATQARFDRLAAKRKALEDAEKEMDDNDSARSGKKGSKGSTDSDGSTPKRKSISEMSDKELRDAIERARMEDTYRQLRPEQLPKSKQIMNKFLNEALVPAAVEGGKNLLKDAISKAGESVMKEKVDPNSYEALKKTFDKLKVKQDIDKIENPDKYLSEEDKNKRQQREFNDADREAQKRGYKNVQEEQAAKREKAEKKAQADADAEKAAKAAKLQAKRDAMDREATDKVTQTFMNKTTETKTPRSSIKNLLGDAVILSDTVSSVPSTTVNNGRSYVDNINWGRYDLSANRWDDD